MQVETAGGDVPDGAGRSSGRAVPAIASALLVALVAPHIGRRPFWLDESATASLVSSGWGTFSRVVIHREINMSAYYLALRPVAAIGEHSELALRLPSLAAAVAAVWYLHGLVGRYWGALAAGVAAVCLAVNPVVLHYGQEARSYSAAMLAVTASTYHLLRATEPGGGRRHWAWWAGWSSVAPFLHTYCVFVLAGQAVVLGARWLRARDRPPVLPVTLVAVAAAMFVVLLQRTDQGQLGWIGRPTAGSLVKEVGAATGLGWGVVGVAGLALAVTAGGLAARRWGQRDLTAIPGIALAVWAVAPLLFAVVLTYSIEPVLRDRYLIVSVPAVAGLFGTLAAALPAGPRLLRASAVSALCVLPAAAAVSIVLAGPLIQDFPRVVRILGAQQQAGDRLVVLPQYYRLPLDWYLDRAAGRSGRELAAGYPAVPIGSYGPGQMLVKAAGPRPLQTAPGRLWVVLRSPTDLPAGSPFGRWLAEHYTCSQDMLVTGLTVRLCTDRALPPTSPSPRPRPPPQNGET
jgi:4-amino-4-deoxy-L-arabinose transferase-like glycosyltransferase